MSKMTRLSHHAGRFLDGMIMLAGLALFVLACFYVVAGWNMRWGTGNLLIPAADDWNDIPAFSQYLQHQAYLALLLATYQGHPQLLIKLVGFLYYQLGFTNYKDIISINVFLQLIPIFVYSYLLWKDEFTPTSLKCMLTPIPLLLTFDSNWLVFLRVSQGYVWAFGYVFAFLSFLMMTFVDNAKHKQLFLFYATLLAFISCHFFVAAFTVWPALFYFAILSRWNWKNYPILILGMGFSVTLYILMQQNGHDFTSNSTMIFDHPLNFIKYMILIFGENGWTDYSQNITSYQHYLISGVTFSLSVFYILKYLIYKPTSSFERFIATLLLVCFLIICGVAFGRLEQTIETSPFHYIPCVLNLYIPLFTILALEGYRLFGRVSHFALLAIIGIFLSYSTSFYSVTHNQASIFPPSSGPNYERISIMLFSLLDLPSFQTISTLTPEILPNINVVAMHKYGFAGSPDLAYRGKLIGKDIPIKTSQANSSVACSGDLYEENKYNFGQWPLIELKGWAWNHADNSIPKLILLTDGNNKIINTAPGEMTQLIKQTEQRSTWLAYIPYEKIDNMHINEIKMWVLTQNNQACFVKSFSSKQLVRVAEKHKDIVFTLLPFEQTHVLP